MTEGWIEPQQWPALADGEVHVWAAHLPSLRALLDPLANLLSPEERERAARFRLPVHGERSQMTRGLLRLLLGRYLERPPRELTFVFNAHGKPELPDTVLRFNASHSGECAAFAFTRAGSVGVDIEQVRNDLTRREEIARRHFAPGECAQLESIGGERAFYDLWTCKEAFVKARGDGVFSGLAQFEVLLQGPRVLSVLGRPAPDWWLARLPEIAGCSGAVAVNANGCSPRFWNCTAAIASAELP